MECSGWIEEQKKKCIREFLEMAKFKTRIKKNVLLLQVRQVQSDAANNQLTSPVLLSSVVEKKKTDGCSKIPC